MNELTAYFGAYCVILLGLVSFLALTIISASLLVRLWEFIMYLIMK